MKSLEFKKEIMKTKTLSVNGSELKSILDKIVLDNDLFELDVDYFWEIDNKEIYDQTKDPKSFGLGQISEEWEMLQKHLNDNDFYPLNMDLRTFGRILKAIGDTIDQVDTNKHREKVNSAV